ncbi:hypothetical protein IQ06DRAFT_300005 [Phaeosphaeriaceae sp. SRC1lsM3a]|nr:hypothetical protein IQ06DRAFT_300005 [Stagonospora sp. SRC1lsM3a]
MRSNILTFAVCAFAIPASVVARPNVYDIAARNIELGRATHPISVRRRNQRAQVEQAQQLSCGEQAAAPAAAEKEKAGAAEKGNAAAAEKEKAAAAEKGNAAAAEKEKAAAAEKEKAAAAEKEKAAAAEKEKAAAEKEKEAAAGGEAAAGEEENKENEVEIETTFDTATAVQGGDLKQDLVFTPSTVGKFEFEFQGAAADEITVTENVGGAAAAPPAGFEAIEPNSYTVALAVSKGAGLTLSKIDYIFDAAAAGLVGKDATKAQVGRLCTETNSFVISETLGELEFEAEENEVTLNLNKNVTAEGQWGIFLPVAVAAGEGAAAANGTAEAGKGKGKGNANAGKEKAAKGKAKAGEGMAAADAAKEKAAQQNEALAALLEAAQKEQAASAAKGAHAMRRK